MFSASQLQRLLELIQSGNIFGIDNLFHAHFGICWKEEGYLYV